MWEILPILLTVLPKSISHVPVNQTDVLIIGKHADLHRDEVFITTKRAAEETTVKKIDTTTIAVIDDEQFGEKDDIVFVPTEREYYLRRDENVDKVHEDLRLTDILENKGKTTESSDTGVLFISGKNQEKEADPERTRANDDTHQEYERVLPKDTKVTPKPLDCTNLDCDNDPQPICGMKKEGPSLRYRLFRNECYFRKVNCGFEYEFNRFKEVDMKKCNNAGVYNDTKHNIQPGHLYRYSPPTKRESPPKIVTQKPISGRRAMSINVFGAPCGHICPLICTDDYKPECALSSTGIKKVFMNHCQLDLHSCNFGVMWQKRPLSECVGGKRADMEHNKSFITWMQKAGILDKKGRLVLS